MKKWMLLLVFDLLFVLGNAQNKHDYQWVIGDGTLGRGMIINFLSNELEVGGFASGLYFVRMEDEKGRSRALLFVKE